MLGLGIESSCDETSVAVVEEGRKSLANVIFSQIEQHALFEGVVPEIASRAHLEQINYVYAEAIRQAGVRADDLDYLAVTLQPGLIGSLMIGANFAKCLHLVTKAPIIGVDHLEAHFYAPCLEGRELQYPFLGLLLSGGNSALYYVRAAGNMSLIADTMDDACGEAFDKAASIAGLPYPGGPFIEKMAEDYLSRAASMTNGERPLYRERPLFGTLLKNLPAEKMAFSFSGIKTAVARAFKQGVPVEEICYNFQETIFELIERNLRRALRKTGLKRLVAGGGVLANGALQQRLLQFAAREEIELIYPKQKLHCTDNAGMIAALGYFLYPLKGSGAEGCRLNFEVSSKRYLPYQQRLYKL